MGGHVLTLNTELYRQWAELHNFAYAQADRKRDHVAALPYVPVDQHVGRCADRPTRSWKIRVKILKIHLTCRIRSRAADGPPLLRKYAREPLLAQIAENTGGSDLPLILAKARIAGGRENASRTRSEQPRARQFRTRRE